MFKQDLETISQITQKQALDDLEARRKAKKYGKSSDDRDGELLGALIIFTGYAVYQEAKVLGKAAI